MNNLPENNIHHYSTETSNKFADRKHGVSNWLLMFFLILLGNLLIENYLSYGIVTDPIKMTRTFMIFISQNWWIYAVLFLCYILQILLCYFNEKLLAEKTIPEKFGMIVHACNSLLLLNFSVILFSFYDFNMVAGIAVMPHIFLVSLRFWAYGYSNMILRTKISGKISTTNAELNGNANGNEKLITQDDAVDIKYPQNVTLRDTFMFHAGTGACIYVIRSPKRISPKVRKIFVGMIKAIAIHYAVAFLIYQFLIPEADKAASYIAKQEYLGMFGSILRLSLPLNTAWLLFYYYYGFKCFFPVFGWTWGTDDVIAYQDWWNAENSTIFWTKWSYQVHLWFKECLFLPVLRAGYSKRTAALVVAFVSGLLHEYLITFPARAGYGLAMFSMLFQIPFAHVTTFVAKRMGSKWGNFMVWLSLVFGFSSCAVLAYYYNYVVKK